MLWLLALTVLVGCSKQYQRDVYFHGDRAQPKIALTFDDGPNEPYTSQILDVLRREDVHATFFLLGTRVEKQPESARAIVAAGHAIGNHSYTHPDMAWENAAQVVREVEYAEAVIQATTGIRPRMFRPPFGSMYPGMVREIRHLGYAIIHWTVAGKDWYKPPHADQIARRILARIGNGGIILLHDGNGTRSGDRSQTVKALQQIIPELKRRGFQFVTVPELLGVDP